MIWQISGSGSGPYDIQDQDGNHVATLSQVRGGLPVALRIGAAQEMFEALKDIETLIEDSHGVAGFHLNGDDAAWDEFVEIDAVLAVLAKAEGRKP